MLASVSRRTLSSLRFWDSHLALSPGTGPALQAHQIWRVLVDAPKSTPGGGAGQASRVGPGRHQTLHGTPKSAAAKGDVRRIDIRTEGG